MIFDAGTHERVIFGQDPASGLRAVIAIYSTVLGPALGGTRFYPYPDEAAAVSDVLDLSRGMAYKAALAGLPLGGGKAVIIGDPQSDKTSALLTAYGRLVETLRGDYITACDVGTTVEDMDVVSTVCSSVTGRSVARGGAGDSSVLTAFGVFQGMRACAAWRWGSDSLAGRTVAISGVGKVGSHLVDHAVEAGARVLIADVDRLAVESVLHRHDQVRALAVDELPGADMDIFAPCALGGALDDGTVAVLRAEVVCGAANNQLAHDDIADVLAARGILYAPDYLVNAGGLVQVEDERHGFNFERARTRVERLYDTALEVFRVAESRALTPVRAADQLAEERMSKAAVARVS